MSLAYSSPSKYARDTKGKATLSGTDRTCLTNIERRYLFGVDDTGKRYNLQSNSKSKEYTWIASYQGIDPADGNSFSFWLFETGQTGSLFSSHTFNITDPTSTTQSATQSTRTRHPQTKITTEATETTEIAGEPTSSSKIVDATPPPGLSSDAIAGISVGSVVGCLLIAGAALMFWRRTGRKEASQPTESEAAKFGAVEAPNDNEARHGPWEMGDATTQAHELSATDQTYNYRTGRWA
ncbi:hypothetical protein HYE68_002111 [Fusarium pseudograminearum]|nr:hypothetical protein HYE68_002111 [Fusarium pseudograminearum]